MAIDDRDCRSAAMETGALVRFNHERRGGPVHRVASIATDGMIELEDMGGFFAPHLFEIANDIADIPPTIPQTDPIGRPIDWQKRYKRMVSAFDELQVAADKVVTETDRIHDTRPWPQKYAAPYGAIAELRILLAKQRGLR